MIAEGDAPGNQEHFRYLTPLPVADSVREH
jgi:hypothetical protein